MATVVIGARNRQQQLEGSGHGAQGDASPGDTQAASRPGSGKQISVPAGSDEVGLRKLRLNVWNALGDPSSSTSAYIIFIVVLTLILISCVSFVVETIPSYCCGRYDHVSGASLAGRWGKPCSAVAWPLISLSFLLPIECARASNLED